MQQCLDALQEAGGSMTRREFYKLAGIYYKTTKSQQACIAKMRTKGLIEERIFITKLGTERNPES